MSVTCPSGSTTRARTSRVAALDDASESAIPTLLHAMLTSAEPMPIEKAVVTPVSVITSGAFSPRRTRQCSRQRRWSAEP